MEKHVFVKKPFVVYHIVTFWTGETGTDNEIDPVTCYQMINKMSVCKTVIPPPPPPPPATLILEVAKFIY